MVWVFIVVIVVYSNVLLILFCVYSDVLMWIVFSSVLGRISIEDLYVVYVGFSLWLGSVGVVSSIMGLLWVVELF